MSLSDERRVPTPMERLEAWVNTDPMYRFVILTYDGAEWSAELYPTDQSALFVGFGGTADAAILAALDAAEGK